MGRWRDIYGALYVAKSRFAGRGLFAGGRIRARAKIGEYEGERISLTEARRRAKGRAIVAIVELDRFALDAKGMRRGFRYINHSCDPNTFFRCTPDRAEVYARRAIRKDEELTCDYGQSQHEGRLRCRCGSAKCRGFL